MRARVTNNSRGARGLQSVDRGTVMIEPGASAELDLANHDLHRIWEEAGDLAIMLTPEAGVAPAPVADKPKPKRR